MLRAWHPLEAHSQNTAFKPGVPRATFRIVGAIRRSRECDEAINAKGGNTYSGAPTSFVTINAKDGNRYSGAQANLSLVSGPRRSSLGMTVVSGNEITREWVGPFFSPFPLPSPYRSLSDTGRRRARD